MDRRVAVILGLAGVLCLSACGQGAVSLAEVAEVADKAGDPPLETPTELLDAALNCSEFTHPERQAVLLVHGTGTYGEEQYSWNYRPWLEARGFDVCTVTYPDRGFGDQQMAAEYVVHAVRSVYRQTGRKLDMIGHSQGGSMPRWAIKWWPGIRSMLDDFVMHAAVNHGTYLGAGAGTTPLPMPAAFFQFSPDSNFVRALNAGDETPGQIDYTSIYTLYDELVQPQQPESTSALDHGQDNPKVSNILLQDLCPGYPAEHVSIGLTDALTAELTLDALVHPGPADARRVMESSSCFALSMLEPGTAVPGLFSAGGGFFASVPPQFHSSYAEPPLKPYAQGEAGGR